MVLFMSGFLVGIAACWLMVWYSGRRGWSRIHFKIDIDR